jgi:hypothetical protein
MTMREIKRGDRGRFVAIIQYILAIVADGIFGRVTEMAVRAFQTLHGLAVDGIAGELTWAKILETRPKLQKGSVGANVKAIQYILGNLAIDGQFGPITDAAVRAFQKANGLSPDGIVGPLTWEKLLGAAAVNGQPVDYKQYASAWASVMYSNHGDRNQTIKSSGCGPTAMADILATWLDPAITPVEMCELAIKNGFRTYNDGTAQAFFPFVAQRYGLKCVVTSKTDDVVLAVKSGALVVALMGKGYWTNGGHYICLWDVRGDQIYANDPASPSRTHASIALFKSQSKKYFIFTR